MFEETPLSVPLASQDLAPIESLLQTFNNLQQLHNNIDEIFNRLHTRISSEREKISDFSERLKQADAKIRHISNNPNRVCTIFSAAKFPASLTGEPIAKIIPDNDPTLPKPLPKNNYKLVESQRLQRSDDDPSTVDLLQELTQATSRRAEKSIGSDIHKEGLGRLPSNLSSVSEAILFNSDDNPYKKYESFNNLESVADARNKVKTEKLLAAAPKTIAEGIELPSFVGLQFDYKPDIGFVPTFQLPTSLGLKNVADITYSDATSTYSSIAPSNTTLPDLPTFGLTSPTSATGGGGAKRQISTVPQNYHSLGVTSAPPPAVAPPPAAAPPAAVQAPPPAQPPSQQQQAPQQTQSQPQQQQQQQQAPPPAAQPAAPANDSQPAPQAAAPAKAALPPVPDNRVNLLAQIKGGLKLHKVDKSEEDNKPPPTDLKAVLFAGIKRHADLLSGRGSASPKQSSKTAQPGIQLKDERLRQRLEMLSKGESDSESEESDFF